MAAEPNHQRPWTYRAAECRQAPRRWRRTTIWAPDAVDARDRRQVPPRAQVGRQLQRPARSARSDPDVAVPEPSSPTATSTAAPIRSDRHRPIRMCWPSRPPTQARSRRRTTQGADPANYDLVEKVSAGYVMNTDRLLDRARGWWPAFVLKTPICRRSASTLRQTRLSDRANGSYHQRPAERVHSLRGDAEYELPDRVQPRAVASRSAVDIAQSVTFTSTGSPGSLKNTASLGNPDLKAEVARTTSTCCSSTTSSPSASSLADCSTRNSPTPS